MLEFFPSWQELIDFWKDGWLFIIETAMLPFVFIFESIPAPDWTQNIGALSIPNDVAWFISAFEMPTGIAIMVSALTIRFLIRRIPFIG